MSEIGLLTPREAEAVIEDRIEQFGLGALPHVTVTELADGTGGALGASEAVAPMTEAPVRVDQGNVGPSVTEYRLNSLLTSRTSKRGRLRCSAQTAR
jgi:hypothetical protein